MNNLKNKSFIYFHYVFFAIFLLCCKEIAFADAEISMTDPSLLVDADNTSISVWNHNVNGEVNVSSSTLPFGSTTWTNPVIISATGTYINRLSTKMDPLGNILAVWSSYDPNAGLAFINANFKLNGSAWDVPINISGPTQNTNDIFSLGIAGDFMHVTWSAYDENSQNMLYSATGSTDTGWSSPQLIVAPSFYGY